MQEVGHLRQSCQAKAQELKELCDVCSLSFLSVLDAGYPLEKSSPPKALEGGNEEWDQRQKQVACKWQGQDWVGPEDRLGISSWTGV